MTNGVYQPKRHGLSPLGACGEMSTDDGPPEMTDEPVMSMRRISPFWCS